MRGPLALLCLALTLVGCRGTKVGQAGCTQDGDCGPASDYRCDTRNNVCYCRTDAACAPSEFCNPIGFCQGRAGCLANLDCAKGSFCDTASGKCLSEGRCTSDLHCALGTVCDVSKGSCVTGCHSSGDCSQGACRCGDVACRCTGTTPAEVAACAIGECDPYFCGSANDCRFGERCGTPDGGMTDAGAGRASCFNDFDSELRPYCSRCTSGAGISTCGTGANFCIIDTRTSSTYCGADCSEGQECPRGYGCRDIRIVFSRLQCSDTQPCQPDMSHPCSGDADCKRGSTCAKPTGAATGYCKSQCWRREGSAFGYCTCQENQDCPQQTCSQGECSITRKKCVVDEDCKQISCVDFDGIGACLIGQNCTPSNGLTCIEVKAQ
ncbi:MAG: hypothetical protein K1X89_00240 [Myxococcaceae bacterium]|nr:hypothetical protein [Myxococcaceae bacterium]